MPSHMSVQPFLPHNDLGVEEKNRSRAHFPPVLERPNLGKHVSVNLCHIAGLRIPIVPMIEPFHFKKAIRKAENILHPELTDAFAFVYMRPGKWMCPYWRDGWFTPARTCRYRQIKNGSRVAWDHTCPGSLRAFNTVCLGSHLLCAKAARYEARLIGAISLYILNVINDDYLIGS